MLPPTVHYTDPVTHALAYSGIERAVDVYLFSLSKSVYKDLWKVPTSTSTPVPVPPPDANVILDIYGSHLFSTVISDTPGYYYLLAKFLNLSDIHVL